MNQLFDLALMRPYWLLALPFIAGLAYLFHRRQSGIGDWEKLIDSHLMDAMRGMGRVGKPNTGVRLFLPFIVMALISIAAAGPSLERRDAKAFRNLDGVVFVMDVSSSMMDDDLWPKTVTMGRVGISALGSKPAALVVYGGDSYLASALTIDTHQIGLTMTLLDNKTVPDQGSRPALALQQAGKILEDAEIISGDVFLMSDGGGLDSKSLIAAKRIVKQGGRVSMIYAPTTVSKMRTVERARLEAFVKVGNGQLYQLGETDRLISDLKQNTVERLGRQDLQLLFWSDYGRYLLLLALLPLLGLFRRRRLT